LRGAFAHGKFLGISRLIRFDICGIKALSLLKRIGILFFSTKTF